MIINHYAGSDKYGMEFRPFYLSRELVKLGHDVTVIAADCSHLRKNNPVIDKSFTEEIIESVRYVFLRTVKYQRNNVKRILNMMSFLLQLKMNSKMLYKRYLPDIIIASSTYPYDVKSAKNIAKFGENTKVCYEIHDIWPLSLIEIYKINPKNPYMKSLQRAENFAYNNADLVVSILPDVNRHIEELGFYNTNYVHIPNGIIVDDKSNLPAPNFILDEVKQLKAKGKFILMYLGGFSQANALDDLFDSAKKMPEEVQIMMVGDGPLKEQYKEKIKLNSITNISLMESVLKSQVNSTLKLADTLYIGAKRTKLYQYGVGMNKIFDYMLAKRPILYGIEASNNMITDASCGITIEPESAEAIVEGTKQLLSQNESSLNAMGQNGYEYVLENHDYTKLAKRFIDAINGCGGQE
ncbi:MAG: glycosyltransferase family 4 protein [Oscillospiraceae bacterium]